MKRLYNIIDNINEWTGKIFSWVLLIFLLLTVIEVILRKFFNSPTIWNLEITVQLYALHFLMLSGYTLLHNAHVNIDCIYAKFNERTRAVLDVVGYSVLFFPFGFIILYQGVKYSLKSWSIFETGWGNFPIPLYPIKTFIPLMAFLLLIQGVAIFCQKLYFAIRGREL